ncbi:hypothetical protein C8T65DRAFT_746015 [Cerioporus squamosus]|nr:hypothetical protein C8T65DRAFT_746015 [Cerioporus squamosus]
MSDTLPLLQSPRTLAYTPRHTASSTFFCASNAHMTTVQPPPLALTTLLSIRVSGLAIDTNGAAVTLDLPRQDPGAPRQSYQPAPPRSMIKYDSEVPQLRLPSRPRPGVVRASLDLRAGDVISSNERHAVYDVEVTKINPPGAFDVPPLVIKVADTLLLAEEAGMYGHIEELQGVVAPRYYGYFRASLNPDSMRYVVPPSEDSDSDEPSEPRAYTGVDILLLEKVGGHIPMYRPDNYPPELEVLMDDLDHMHYDLAELNVVYEDWRTENIAYAPTSPPGLPGLPSPYHDPVYGLRMIDFERALVTNMKPEYVRANIIHKKTRIIFLDIIQDLLY